MDTPKWWITVWTTCPSSTLSKWQSQDLNPGNHCSLLHLGLDLKHLAQHLAHNKHLVKAIILSLIFIIIFQTLESAYNSFNLLLIFFCIIAPIINYGKACECPVVLFAYFHAVYYLISIKLWIHHGNVLHSWVSSVTFVVLREEKKQLLLQTKSQKGTCLSGSQ